MKIEKLWILASHSEKEKQIIIKINEIIDSLPQNTRELPDLSSSPCAHEETESPQGELPKIPGAKPREPGEVDRAMKPLKDLLKNMAHLPHTGTGGGNGHTDRYGHEYRIGIVTIPQEKMDESKLFSLSVWYKDGISQNGLKVYSNGELKKTEGKWEMISITNI